ncbi:MAG: VWA domain-containing protein [Deltaproteobacteria bacterium]|nr:VWA domain-containing protein [Deltaproteobacteria bacterium]
MKQTDPRGARKIAAGIFVNLLEPTDMISIIEFEKDAKVLLPLTAASEKKKAIEVIEKIGETGEFTDFRKALEVASKELEKVKDGKISKMVVFFTDGILEPDLTDPIYRPYNREYLKEIGHAKQASQRQTIRNKFTELVIPKAERIIHEDVLPGIMEKGAEVYAIALTDKANTILLRDIVDKTTRHPEENHFFLANSYRDLTKQFIKVLGCRRPIFIAYERDGVVKGFHKENVFLDPYIQNVNFSLIADHRGIDIELSNPSGKKFPYSTEIGGVFYDFSDIPFEAGEWGVQLKGEGKFTLLAMAKSKIEIDVKGLRKIYKCKDPVELTIRLLSDGKFLPEENFGALDYSISLRNPLGKEIESKTQKQKGEFKFFYNPDIQGNYHLSVELKAKDKQSREILPRPSKELSFQVERALFITPREIYFGNYLLGGKKIVRKVDIESCLEERIEMEGEISKITCSNKYFNSKDSSRTPQINLNKFSLDAGSKKTVDIGLELPKKVYRGDYKGVIRIFSNRIDPQAITFRVHIYTFWEMLKFLIPPLVALLSAIGGYFVYIWGYLGSPFGVLMPIKVPTGDLLGSIKLSQVRRGLFSRWFNWRRNRILIKNKGGEINLSALPANLQIELSFYRRGKAYIRNQSPEDSAQRISVEEPDFKTPFVRGPGQSLSLKHRSIITLDGYQFRFERI